MTSTRAPSRRPSLGLTTSGLVVLVAMASAASAAGSCPISSEARGRAADARAVRVVAAAMAAAARDLVGTEAAPMVLATASEPAALPAPAVFGAPSMEHEAPAICDRLGPQRLDLPPPLS